MTSKPRSEVAEGAPITIGALSRATRIPVETLRTWERRYGAPVPMRRPSGHRRYPAASVEHLRRVGRLLARGHRAGEILGLPIRELDALLSLSDPQGASRRPDLPPPATAAENPGQHVPVLLRATEDLDRDSLMRELRVSWMRFGPLRFLQGVAGPFMIEIGKAWERRSLDVRHEHFASGCLADFLREAREPHDHLARGPRVAAAMLPGDMHEGGLLMACALLAVRGYRVVYLGANTPIEEIAAAGETGNIDIVMVSVSAAVRRRRAAEAVARLREALPARMPLWIGGAGAPPAPPRVERFVTLEALDQRLAAQA